MEESKMSFFNDIVFKEFNMNNSKNGKENEEEDFPSIRRQGSLFRTNIDLLNCFDHDEDQEEKKPNHNNEPNGMESNENIKNIKNVGGKGTIIEKGENDSKKQKKLLMNRISAKKSRQKKKEYVTYLENEIERLKKEKNNIKKYQNANNKSNINNQMNSNGNCVNNSMNKKNKDLKYLIKKQQELTELQIKSKVNNEKDEIEYTKIQKKVLYTLFINHIKYLMPLKLKIFQQKYLKMEPFLEGDTLEDLLYKININIDTLNALYDFSKTDQKDSISMQFMSYYTQLKKYVLNFKENYDLL